MAMPATHSTVAAHQLDRLVIIRPWPDPVVESIGFEPRSRYVEMFWLGVLGPSATWLLRRIVDGLDSYPDGYELDLVETALGMGLVFTPGRHGPFSRALQRCVLFGIATNTGDGLAIRRRVPPLAARHLDRLPEHLRVAHREWMRTPPTGIDRMRACALAESLAAAGDGPEDIERRLALIGIDARTAGEVAWASVADAA